MLKVRTQAGDKSEDWISGQKFEEFDPKKSAIVICDMWDNHWCRGAAGRVKRLALQMVPVLDAARRHGVLIVHAPSDTMEFYKDTAQRKVAESAPPVKTPESLIISEPALPIDFATGGCDTSPPDSFYKAWSCETPLIPVAKNDLISADGHEVYNNLKLRGINTVVYVGVHANICILKRSFAIRQMRQWGIHCILIRDLTDAMYDPHDSPYVSHEQGTELVIKHIERYLAPSTLSSDFVTALGR